MRGSGRAVMVLAVAASTLPLAGARHGTAVRYDIDMARSQAGFTVLHLGVLTEGSFTRFGGHIMLDEQDVTRSSVDMTVETASIDAGSDARNVRLRGPLYFDVERYPTMRFVGRRVERDEDQLFVIGDFTLRGVTRQVRVPVELTGPYLGAEDTRRIRTRAAVRINRFSFGMISNEVHNSAQLVGSEVQIQLNIEAATVRQAPGGLQEER